MGTERTGRGFQRGAESPPAPSRMTRSWPARKTRASPEVHGVITFPGVAADDTASDGGLGRWARTAGTAGGAHKPSTAHTLFTGAELCIAHTGPYLTRRLHFIPVREVQLLIKMKINVCKSTPKPSPQKCNDHKETRLHSPAGQQESPLPHDFMSHCIFLDITFHFTHCQTLLAAPSIAVAMGTPGGKVGTAPGSQRCHWPG